MSHGPDDRSALEERAERLQLDAAEISRERRRVAEALRALPGRAEPDTVVASYRDARDVLQERAGNLKRDAAEIARERERVEEALRAPAAPNTRRASWPIVVIPFATALGVLGVAGLAFTPSRRPSRSTCSEAMLADPVVKGRMLASGCDPMLVRSADSLPGGPHAVAPLMLLPAAREAAKGERRLVRVEIPVLPPSGQIDLWTNAYWGTVEFEFANDDTGQDVGVVIVDFQGLRAFSHRVAWGAPVAPVPDPRCSLDAVRDAVVRAGASDDAPLHVTYEMLDGRAGWRVDGGGKTWALDEDTCALPFGPQ